MTKRLALAATFDVVAIVLFVVIGRRSHEEGNSLRGVLRVAAPLLCGLLAGWLVARMWRAPTEVVTGLVIWPVTVAVGISLRRFAWDDGTALPFIIVTAAFTGVFFVGWRALYR